MITERIFGEIKGISINEVTIHNKAGMEVSILSYGATIRSVIVPTADGKKRNPGMQKGLCSGSSAILCSTNGLYSRF